MKRTFIAVKITPAEKLLATYQLLRNELAKEHIKWVNSNQFHITLFFLGKTDEGEIPGIRKCLRELTSTRNTFHIHMNGIGVFKNFQNPRVLWVGVNDYEQMKNVKESIDEEMSLFGFQPEQRDFRPHLTIGRIKKMNDREMLKNLVSRYSDEYFQKAEMEEIIYYESILTSTGPIYKAIDKYRLQDSGR